MVTAALKDALKAGAIVTRNAVVILPLDAQNVVLQVKAALTCAGMATVRAGGVRGVLVVIFAPNVLTVPSYALQAHVARLKLNVLGHALIVAVVVVRVLQTVRHVVVIAQGPVVVVNVAVLLLPADANAHRAANRPHNVAASPARHVNHAVAHGGAVMVDAQVVQKECHILVVAVIV